MGLIVSVVPFAYGKMREGAQYRDVLRSMVSEMRAARNEAQLSGVGTRFKVDLQNRVYGVDGHAPRSIPDSVSVKATVADRELSADQVAAITFCPTAGPPAAASMCFARLAQARVCVSIGCLVGSWLKL